MDAGEAIILQGYAVTGVATAADQAIITQGYANTATAETFVRTTWRSPLNRTSVLKPGKIDRLNLRRTYRTPGAGENR